MKNEDHLTGFSQGMFEHNIMTFNPGWDSNAEPPEFFTDVWELPAELQVSGIKLDADVDANTSGPASIMLKDPDGNTILIDQHV